ncbi:hypothetical protein [Dyella silvatica]|nr:hypothetical protein [Dyella silvatica]
MNRRCRAWRAVAMVALDSPMRLLEGSMNTWRQQWLPLVRENALTL